MPTQHQNSLLNIYKAFAVTALLLSLGACAATGKSNQYETKPPLEISYAPAIDVSYQEVVNRLKAHIGVKVRWGGQIIGSQNVNDLTRLTVIAYPLNAEGRPHRKASNDFEAGRFIVETKNVDASEESRFLTVYGPITGEAVLHNGKLEKVIPVVTAIESKQWNSIEPERRYIERSGRHLPYNGLGYGYSFGFGHGFYSHYPYVYYNVFGGRHFRHGLRISRHGRHH